MATVYGIINRGYFPKELPPSFTSRVYASVLKDNIAGLPNAFVKSERVSKILSHNFLVKGVSRRRLGIPNPTNYFRLATSIVDNWSTLTGITGGSQLSLTSPIFARPPNRAISSKFSFDAVHERRAHVRSQSRYMLKADISQCYHSIYTHSISWAVHGKTKAKARRNDKHLLGNILDRLVRNCQDQQTVGIPIGPDSSLLFAEIILTRADEALCAKGISNGFRVIDDYEFGCDSLTEAERFRDTLQEILCEYELTLNMAKTDITELPTPIEEPWSSRLSGYKFSAGHDNQRRQIIDYFDQAFLLAREYPEHSVLKYSVSRLSGVSVLQSNWALCENLLVQCAVVDPSTIDVVLNQLIRYKDLGFSLDLSNIGGALNKVINAHAPLGHGSEVAWAIWALIVLSLKMKDDVADAAVRMNDSIVGILMLDARRKGSVSPSVEVRELKSHMTTDDLYGENWLLAYEANVKGWLKSATRGDHVNRDTCFSFLKNKGVYFYDDGVSGGVKYRPPKPLAGGEEY